METLKKTILAKRSDDGLRETLLLAIFKLNLCSPAGNLHGLLSGNYFGINSDAPSPPIPISIQTVVWEDFLRGGKCSARNWASGPPHSPPPPSSPLLPSRHSIERWLFMSLPACLPIYLSVWVFWVFWALCCSARSCLTSCTPKAARNTAPGESRWHWCRCCDVDGMDNQVAGWLVDSVRSETEGPLAALPSFWPADCLSCCFATDCWCSI